MLDDGGKVVSGERVVNGDYKKRMVKLGLPNIPGSYMLRYWSGEGRQSLAEAPITIEPVETSLDGPASVPAGELFEVSWIGPASRRDEVQVFDPDKGGNGQSIASARVVNGDMKAKTVRIKAPKQAGSYKLRYYGVQDRVVLFETDITVE